MLLLLLSLDSLVRLRSSRKPTAGRTTSGSFLELFQSNPTYCPQQQGKEPQSALAVYKTMELV
ncbi:hypothetical protein UY3_08958 [Chelonia mydas]|uniref:Uncharacterized protein n=1 Tax=Chelonia mydas TaxID=8469 RepID=M7BE84_CHEMY|nr:hypothetical protein UY3_08958 [Chelonia mydas]